MLNEEKWHVLQVKPRSEKKVGQRLRDLGFESCVPTQKQLRKWSDRKKLIDVVLFNNYVFVATDQQRRNEVYQVGNIFGYLQFGGRAALLTDKEVAMIKQFGHISEPVSISYDGFSRYDEVEIISGSLTGFRGIVTAVNGATRLQLALPSLHCFANVELKQTEIRRVTAH
ncbi:transcription termination/antitermination protein NusG [Haliscomenobacter hydrossis]|uniref:NGN domain-containing protein n=1 Tax=Haliscomenobacter hydrossis (strain ATCC 27775 / DSM 1100 / LMG 10767 / O) TaxID=760192 RepID=F4L0H9_HALH1|nr:UpxY family transcription antiterminator [Haliscomenobacter hydrossis]AEE48491.1 NGN domain-containing protein [Haliscomenobacter hydrossis DSM 1100]